MWHCCHMSTSDVPAGPLMEPPTTAVGPSSEAHIQHNAKNKVNHTSFSVMTLPGINDIICCEISQEPQSSIAHSIAPQQWCKLSLYCLNICLGSWATLPAYCRYAEKDARITFSATPLGEALVSGYGAMGLANLWTPDLRGKTRGRHLRRRRRPAHQGAHYCRFSLRTVWAITRSSDLAYPFKSEVVVESRCPGI